MATSKHIVVDVESNGPVIGQDSMIAFGMVIVEPGFGRTFKGLVRPISEHYVPSALAVSGFTHEETKEFDEPELVMKAASQWIKENVNGMPLFWSDNNGYDKPWMHWYFLNFNDGVDPFGHSSRRIADFICGVEKDIRFQWKKLREFPHTHDPVDDAKGNASVLLKYFEKIGCR